MRNWRILLTVFCFAAMVSMVLNGGRNSIQITGRLSHQWKRSGPLRRIVRVWWQSSIIQYTMGKTKDKEQRRKFCNFVSIYVFGRDTRWCFQYSWLDCDIVIIIIEMQGSLLSLLYPCLQFLGWSTKPKKQMLWAVEVTSFISLHFKKLMMIKGEIFPVYLSWSSSWVGSEWGRSRSCWSCWGGRGAGQVCRPRWPRCW